MAHETARINPQYSTISDETSRYRLERRDCEMSSLAKAHDRKFIRRIHAMNE
jgi:hypothetical protein